MQKFVSLDFAQATHHFRARDTPHPPRKIIRADLQQAGDSTRSEPARGGGSAVGRTR